MGSGKSSVSKILAGAMGCKLLDTDQFCRDQMDPGQPGYQQFVTLFGNEYIRADGQVDRTLLREAVFQKQEVKEKLEAILHPLVREFVMNMSTRLAITVVEVPLLFEVGWQTDFDYTITVYVPTKTSISRVVKRDGLGSEQVEKIITSQMAIEEKVIKANFIIDNRGTFASTFCQTRWLAGELISQKNRHQ